MASASFQLIQGWARCKAPVNTGAYSKFYVTQRRKEKKKISVSWIRRASSFQTSMQFAASDALILASLFGCRRMTLMMTSIARDFSPGCRVSSAALATPPR